MKNKPIFIVPAMLILVASYFMMCTPSDLVLIYLFGAVSCLLQIGFSSRWPKFLGIGLCLLFLVASGYEAQRGFEWNRDFASRLVELQHKKESESNKLLTKKSQGKKNSDHYHPEMEI